MGLRGRLTAQIPKRRPPAWAGYEDGRYKIFVPGHMKLLTIAPQWVCDLAIAKNQQRLFRAMLEAAQK